MRRFDAGYRQMKEVLSTGSLGAPLMVHCAHRNPTVPESYHSAMAAQDTAVHEIDVLRWLLDDEIVSAQVVTPRATSKRFGHLKDPQIMVFETGEGVRIDLEVFVNCQYGYDIQCEVVGEDGLVRLPDPAAVGIRTAARHGTGVLQDWKDRFAEAFDTEFREWVATVAAGTEPTGPSAWDGYAAPVISDAAVRSQEAGGGDRHRRHQAPPRALRRHRVKIALDPYMFRALPRSTRWCARSPNSATNTSSCRPARTSCRSSCTRGRTTRGWRS
ncbi:Inositol 2-dehydrogenase/D-chiro-inositol 3-dehydrogenase [Streptomyces purpurascens]